MVARLAGNFALILPVFIPILLGLALKRRSFLPDGFWPQAERLTYYVLLPALIADSIATGQLDQLEVGPMLLALLAALLAVTALLYAAKSLLAMEGPTFASVYHGCIRPNGYMSLATGFAVLGQAARPEISVVVAAWVPLGLVLATIVFLRESAGGPITLRGLAERLVRNPLIASVAAGLLLNAIGAGPWLRQVPVLDTIGRAAIAMRLLAVGAGLDLAALRTPGRNLTAALVLSLLVRPALVAAVAFGVGLDRTAAAALIIFAAMPTSPSGYVMAAQMRADAPLMASIIAVQTALSAFTIALVVTLVV
jgi:predicted permease